jgi:hypothetical protein
LAYHAAAGIDQDGVLARLDQQRGSTAVRVRAWTASAEQNDGRPHGPYSCYSAAAISGGAAM